MNGLLDLQPPSQAAYRWFGRCFAWSKRRRLAATKK
jgi:hypothetical protein